MLVFKKGAGAGIGLKHRVSLCPLGDHLIGEDPAGVDLGEIVTELLLVRDGDAASRESGAAFGFG